jgi:hypothetical protein
MAAEENTKDGAFGAECKTTKTTGSKPGKPISRTSFGFELTALTVGNLPRSGRVLRAHSSQFSTARCTGKMMAASRPLSIST